ncbi:hypothetical protein SDC9_163244 [bioreactor metagenome]|uniref:Sporulation integral membrane protein YtvI n=1 Tax=bioreactor metagenome TaxID=1076179 RepID=A0A645FNA2_9ZZZZ
MKKIIIGSLGKLIKAYAILIFITFCEISLGLSFLSLIHVYTGGYIVFIALVVAVVDIMPVLGTGTVLIPWTLYSFIVGDFGLGVGIAVMYAIITILRQYIEPKLVANQLGLPPFVTIIGMYIGLRLFGIIGMFFVPMMIIFLKLLNDEGVIHIWKSLPPDEKTDDDEKPEKGKKKFRWLLYSKKDKQHETNDNKF